MTSFIGRWLRRLLGRGHSTRTGVRERSPTDPWDRAYERWHSAPFPFGHHIDAIDEMKADLVLLDVYIMESALPLDSGHPVARGAVDVPAALAAYRTKAERMLDEADEGREKLREYLDYLALLEDMNSLVEPRLGPAPPPAD